MKKFMVGIVVIFTVIAPSAVAYYTQSSTSGFLLLVSVLMAMLIVRFDSVAEIAIGPLRAKMERAIQEAYASIEQLKSVALSSSRIAVRELVMAQFPIASPQFSNTYELHDEILRVLDSIGVKSSELEQVEDEWRNGVGLIIHREVCQLLNPKSYIGVSRREGVVTESEREAYEAVLAIGNVILSKVPSPRDIRAQLKDFEVAKSVMLRIEELLVEYETFLETNELADPARFDKKISTR